MSERSILRLGSEGLRQEGGHERAMMKEDEMKSTCPMRSIVSKVVKRVRRVGGWEGCRKSVVSGPKMGAPTEKDGAGEGGEQVSKRELKKVSFEEVQKHNTKKDCWLVVDNKVYDVSKFIPYHPGGSILARYAGQDATDAFYAFHGEEPGSPGITALPRYLVGQLAEPLKLAPHLEDFRALRKQIASEGLMQADIRWFAGMLACYATVYISAILTLWALPPHWISTLVSATIMGLCWGQGGLLQHDLGHNAVFFNCKQNYTAHVLFYTLLMGGSADWWKGRHTRHHASPNHTELDLDIRTLPLFAWDKKQYKKSVRSVTRWQTWYWPFFGPPSMLLVYRVLNTLWMIRQFNWAESLALATHFSFLGYLTFMGSYSNWLLWWTWTLMTGGGYLGWVFAMNHTMFPIFRKDELERDWVTATLTTTQNVTPSFVVDYATGHLDYQVEHHLWPRMPRHNYEIVHPRLKALCQKHNLPFFEESWTQAIGSIYRTLHQATLPETAEEAAVPQPKHY